MFYHSIIYLIHNFAILTPLCIIHLLILLCVVLPSLCLLNCDINFLSPEFFFFSRNKVAYPKSGFMEATLNIVGATMYLSGGYTKLKVDLVLGFQF